VKVLLVDNFDSFSFNLVHYLEKLDAEVVVETNVSVSLDRLSEYDRIVLSPGPGLPQESGKLMEVVSTAIDLKIPILGVCLGMQAIALHFGDELYNQDGLKHGCAESLTQNGKNVLYQNLPKEFKVGLYHSWAVKLNEHSPLMPTAFSESGVLMSVEHTTLPVYAVQFHPESILSEHGHGVIWNFLRI
jgi:anthranilate synthase component 2